MIAVAAVLLIAYPLLSDDLFYQNMIILSLVLAIGAVGLNIIVGYAGYISLGQSAFIGLGAYTVGIATTRIGGDPFVWVPVAGLVAAAFAALLGVIAMRTRGFAFVIITIAALFILQIVAINWDSLTQGTSGITLPLPRWDISIQNWPFYYTLVALLGASLLLSWWIRRTKIGTGLLAIREDEDKAATIGIDTPVYKIIGFMASAVFLGMAGGVYGYYIAFIDPTAMFDIVISVQIILAVILGGRGTLWGPVLGAATIEPLNELANQEFGGGNSRLLIFGGLLVLTILLLPKGIIPSVRDLWSGARSAARRRWSAVAWASGGRSTASRRRRAGDRSQPARGQGPAQALRGRPGARRLLVRRRGGDDHRPDRAQRVRQDHGLQPDRRHDARRRRRGLVRRPANRSAFTLAACLRGAGADVPDHARVHGHDRARERRRPAAQLLLAPASRRRGEREEAARAEELLAFAGMAEYRDERAEALSFGQRKLVELAQVLMLDPKLILLDEPAGGINPTLIARIAEMIRELNAGQDLPHRRAQHALVLGLCEPVLVLASGECICTGTPDEIQRDHRSSTPTSAPTSSSRSRWPP